MISFEYFFAPYITMGRDPLDRPTVRDEILAYPLPERSSTSMVRYNRTYAQGQGASVDLSNQQTIIYQLQRDAWIPPMRDGVGAFLEFDLLMTCPADNTQKTVFIDIPGMIRECYVRIGSEQVLPNTMGSFGAYWSSWLSRQEAEFMADKGPMFGMNTYDDATGSLLHPFYCQFIMNGYVTAANQAANTVTMTAGNPGSYRQHIIIPLPPISVINNPTGAAFPLSIIDDEVQVQFNLNPASTYVAYANNGTATGNAGLGIPAGHTLTLANYWLQLPQFEVDQRAEEQIRERYERSASDKSEALVFDTVSATIFTQTLADITGNQNQTWNLGGSVQFAEHLEVLIQPGVGLWPASGSARAGITQYQVTLDGRTLSQYPIPCVDPNAATPLLGALTCRAPYERYIEMATALNKREGKGAAVPAITQQQFIGSNAVYTNQGTAVRALAKPYFVIAQPLGCAYGEEDLDGSVSVRSLNILISKTQAAGADVNTTGTTANCVWLLHGRTRVFVSKGEVRIMS
jgi:hypothetical protein